MELAARSIQKLQSLVCLVGTGISTPEGRRDQWAIYFGELFIDKFPRGV